jgi:hypothetical protein
MSFSSALPTESKVKKYRNNKGFILFLAVALIPVVGMAILLLSGGVRIMAAEERLARRLACREDLLASGQAWAVHNRNRLAASQVGIAVPLDVTEFGLSAACIVTLDAVAEDSVRVTVEARANGRTSPRRRRLALDVDGPLGRPFIVEPVVPDPNIPNLHITAPNVRNTTVQHPNPPDPNNTDLDVAAEQLPTSAYSIHQPALVDPNHPR